MDGSPRAGVAVDAGEGPPASTVYGLRWGIKDSFVTYIQKMPDGKRSVSDGAHLDDAGEFVFPPVQSARRVSPDGFEERIWEFAGDVRFAGHYGMLFVRFAAPRIAVRGGVGELTVADPDAQPDGDRRALATVALRGIDPGQGLVGWESTEVLLHGAAVEVFNGVYPVGEPLDPLSFVLPDR